MKFISRTTMATIFTEEIDSAVPRKIEVTSRASGLGSRSAGKNSPSAKPQTNGSNCRATDAFHQLKIGLHAGEQQQHQDADFGNGADHAFLFGNAREKQVLGRRPDQAEHGRPEQ
jgi:phage protein D